MNAGITVVGDNQHKFSVHVNEPEIGSGGFGSVYRCRDMSTSPPEDCAAKRVSVHSEEGRAEFQKEIAVLREVCDHPCVISLMGDAEKGNDGWMFLELAAGGELFEKLMDSRQLSEAEAWPYISRIADALKHCHSKGVAHRDVKLENIMLSAEDPDDIRVIDFGLALQLPLDDNGRPVPTKILDSAGTQAYRAPEITSPSGYEPFAVDVWALGVVTFSLIAGFFPVQEAKLDDLRFRRLAEGQADGKGACESLFAMYNRECPFSDALRRLIDGMLRIEPTARYSFEDVCSSDWLKDDPRVSQGANGDVGEEVFSEMNILYRSAVHGHHTNLGVDQLPIPDDAPKIERQMAQR